MMDERVPQEFYDLVDQFVGLANRMAEEHGASRVSAGILFAAARYNAFRLVTSDPDADRNRETAVSYFVEQYRSMLEENIDELKQDPPGR